MLPHLGGFVPETDTYLMEKDGDICLASLVPAPKWLPTTHGWPKGPLLRAPSFSGVAFPVDLGSVWVVLHMISFLGAVWDRVQLCARDLECTSVIATHGTHYVFSEA